VISALTGTELEHGVRRERCGHLLIVLAGEAILAINVSLWTSQYPASA
jgi:hypothetical protein